jgi:hypothetical protein
MTTVKKLAGILCVLTTMSVTASANSNQLASEWKELRSEKRQIVNMAHELGALARNGHLNSWETHSLNLQALKELVNSSGQRIARIQASSGNAAQLSELSRQLAVVAHHVTELKRSINDNRFAIRTPTYFATAMRLASSAEASRTSTEKFVASVLNASPADPAAE